MLAARKELPRVYSQLVSGPGGCWLWTGACDRDGYGVVKIAGKQYRVHRLTYGWRNGSLRHVSDHRCRVRRCARPDHIEDVSVRVNTVRGESVPGRNARKGVCLRGHALVGANIYWRRTRYGPARECRACWSARRKGT